MFVPYNPLLSELSKLQQTLLKTKRLHALIIKTHLTDNPFYATKLARFYALNNNLTYARRVFDKSPQRSVFLWNSMIRGYAIAHDFDNVVSTFRTMLRSEIMPDSFTFACVIRLCYERSNVDALRMLHGGVVVFGLGWDSICSSALVSAYAKVGLFEEAHQVFCGISEKGLVMYNSMISGYGRCGLWDRGLSMCNEMRSRGIRPDGYTLVSLISGLEDCNLFSVGEMLHGFCLKEGFDSNDHVASALVIMYLRFKSMDHAFEVFRGLYRPDIVTWSALISGCCQCGENEKALLFFRKTSMEGMMPDPVLMSSALVAVASLANVRPGSEIHGYVLRHGLESDVMVSSALISMYSKCGFLSRGLHIFKNMSHRNIVSYNSIIQSLGLHGLASQAFEIFKEISAVGKPDACTFSALLSACCHAGLVHDGKEVFRIMQTEFGIEPWTEHCVYMVKLIGMAGDLEGAYNFVQSLPQPVDSGIYGALLSCCEMHGNSEMAKLVASELFEMKPEKSAYRVMLSRVYAGDGKWRDVKMVRDEITVRDLRKMPGVSLIEGTHQFAA